jgi:chorismate mutase/prephenate dehydratase
MTPDPRKKAVPPAPDRAPVLTDLRRRIDALDDQILTLLNQRGRLVQEVGGNKAAAGEQMFHVPEREAEILERLAEANAGPLPEEAVRVIFREVMSACLALERPLRIAHLGPNGTFSHLAAMRQFGRSAEFLPYEDIPAVFAAVERGEADYGVVPVENSTAGMVSTTLDLVVDSPLVVHGEILMEVHHQLLGRAPDLSDVRVVYSHTQALAQCNDWLRRQLPGARLESVSSTSRAAQLAAQDEHAAAVANVLAAEIYGLSILRKNIEDARVNQTRFFLLSERPADRTGEDRTSLVFAVKNESGALVDALSALAKAGINMTKIESRPSRRGTWEYHFFVDCEGHKDDPRVGGALEKVEERCHFFRILGSYPRAKAVS